MIFKCFIAFAINFAVPFEELVSRLQLALYRYNEENDAQPLYDPMDMRTFSEHHAPGLCKAIIALMTHTYFTIKNKTYTHIYINIHVHV